MERVALSIATEDYDRVRALHDGRVSIEGCTAQFLTLHPEDLFLRALHGHEFDVCELSMSSYLTAVASGTSHYVAVPVFLSRLFRHSAIYVGPSADVAHPHDLIGKRVGVPEYQVTAALWVRGLLEDEYGVTPSAMTWYRGGVDVAGRLEKLPLSLPPDIKVHDIGSGRTLDAMLTAGEIDALVTPRVPPSFMNPGSGVRRLFPNYRTAEQHYFAKTGLFPIMHVLALRRSLAAQHSWLPAALCNAFGEAKDHAIAAFSDDGTQRVTLPWFVAEIADTRRRMGEDFWPYGIDANRRTIEAMLGYAYRHGTTSRPLSCDEIFASVTNSNREALDVNSQ